MKTQVKTVLIAMWVITGVAVGGVAAGVFYFRHRDGEPPAARIYVDHSNEESIANRSPLFDSPQFTLTDQNGKPFGSDQLHGKVWVADFIFTSCTSMCPLMTQQMSEFQTATTGSAVQMVSFSVDPDNDTPKVLKAYAQATKADESRWHFLTGSKETLWTISNAMKLAVGAGDTNHQVMHSSHFLLVDRDGHVRAIYNYNEPGFMKKLQTDAAALAR